MTDSEQEQYCSSYYDKFGLYNDGFPCPDGTHCCKPNDDGIKICCPNNNSKTMPKLHQTSPHSSISYILTTLTPTKTTTTTTKTTKEMIKHQQNPFKFLNKETTQSINDNKEHYKAIINQNLIPPLSK
jgi:hypothetical protein